MESIAMVLFPFIVAQASAAGLRDVNLTRTDDDISSLSTSPFSALLNIIKIFSLSNTDTRQAETAIFSQLLTSFLGLLATGKVMPFVAPVAVGYVVMPLMKLLKSAAKGFFLLGVLGWLIGSLVPAFLTYLGLAGGASAFMARALPPSNPLSQFVGIDPSFIATKGLQYLNMDNEECRAALSCKAGEFIVDNYPTASSLIARSGIISFIESQNSNGAAPYATIALESVQGKLSCKSLAPCEGIRSIESILDLRPVQPLDNGNLTTTTTDAPSTTTPKPTTFPSQNDFVVGAIKRIAQNYYNYNASNWYNLIA